jgi:biopolymer transport protein ExbD
MSIHRREPKEAKEIVPPVTPFLDMAFQILFFFVITFNPSTAREGQMDLSLPNNKSDAAAKDPAKADPLAQSVKEEIDIPADFTVKLLGYNDALNRGKIQSISVTGSTGGEEIIPGNEKKWFEQLREKLSAVKPDEVTDKEGKKRVPVVRMSAGSEVRWAEVMHVMDVCYKSGFQVSFGKPIGG